VLSPKVIGLLLAPIVLTGGGIAAGALVHVQRIVALRAPSRPY
jgi:hypothetical protein